MTAAQAQQQAGTVLDALIADETEAFLARQPRSRELIERSLQSLAGGATSNWQIAEPQAVWLSHGLGSKVPGQSNSSRKRERSVRGELAPWLMTRGRTLAWRSCRT